VGIVKTSARRLCPNIVSSIQTTGAKRVQETDEALVLRSQRSDRQAFETLVRRTARLVYSRIYLDVPDAHRCEDLVQETFLVAWRSIGQVADAKGFRSWLLSVAKTVTLDAVRRESRKKRKLPSFKPSANNDRDQIPDPQPSPADQAEHQEERLHALEMLRTLPDEYRLPLTLRYIGGADYQTIGEQLGLSNGSLRGLLSRGMARLREKMASASTPE
jgi:RNA polymerase sigma-70 factor (ECF subfamily)